MWHLNIMVGFWRLVMGVCGWSNVGCMGCVWAGRPVERVICQTSLIIIEMYWPNRASWLFPYFECPSRSILIANSNPSLVMFHVRWRPAKVHPACKIRPWSKHMRWNYRRCPLLCCCCASSIREMSKHRSYEHPLLAFTNVFHHNLRHDIGRKIHRDGILLRSVLHSPSLELQAWNFLHCG